MWVVFILQMCCDFIYPSLYRWTFGPVAVNFCYEVMPQKTSLYVSLHPRASSSSEVELLDQKLCLFLTFLHDAKFSLKWLNQFTLNQSTWESLIPPNPLQHLVLVKFLLILWEGNVSLWIMRISIFLVKLHIFSYICWL